MRLHAVTGFLVTVNCYTCMDWGLSILIPRPPLMSCFCCCCSMKSGAWRPGKQQKLGMETWEQGI